MVYTDNTHLVADTVEELHSFAVSLGLRREWFQSNPKHPHYDLFGSMVQKAIDRGAKQISSKEIVMFNKDAKNK